ncbi:MAG: precorrin-6y C5,15-methyltransferase (decarboxylating) subunit CbiE [Firmicutes bacterium HGW-Firmicutes-7]|nr:MAG: precorrin-6y C5,15-methyltransferase (decarboxylating) subunit CbiE [Firmicutes bacterium HGW-Firmicutes-7]
MNTVKIVGIGPGHKDYILPIAYKAVEQADLLIGAQRHLEIFTDYRKETYCYSNHLEDLVHTLETSMATKKIVVLVSGDPGFYSLIDFIKDRMGKDAIEVVPGISSFQYLFSQLKQSYKAYLLLSLHGRNLDIGKHLRGSKGLFLLTDRKHSPSQIAKELMTLGFEDYRMVVGENLSYNNQRIEVGRVQTFVDAVFSNLCVVVIDNELE